MQVWVDGRLLDDPGAPVLRVTDHGLTVGDGVFEAIKVVDGHPFALTRHLRRMARSAAGLGLPAPPTDDVRRGVQAVLGAEHVALGKLRITYTGGVAPLGSGRGDNPPTLVVVADHMEPAPQATSVVTVPWPRNERGVLAGLKTTSYAENVVALAYAQQRGGTEAIFANLAGRLCEGTGSNVFYVVGGELRTPSLASGCLAGITPSPAPGVVRRPRGRRAGRGADRGRRDLPGLHDARRAGRDALRRPRARGRAGHDRGPQGLGHPRGAGHRPVAAQPSAARRRSR